MNDKDIKKRNVLTSEEDTYYLDEEEFEEEAPSAQTDSEYDEHDESGYDDIEILREEDLEDDVPTEKNRRRKRRKNKEKKVRRSGKKIFIICSSIIGVLAVVYIGVSVFFMQHFFINTEINGHDFSGKSVSAVEDYMKEQVKDYQLEILEKDDQSDLIDGDAISLTYKKSNEIKEAVKKQNGFLWPKAFFDKNSQKVTVNVSYDTDALNTLIADLKPVTVEQTQPISAMPKFDGEKFTVEPEVYGTAVNMEILTEKIHEYITEFKPALNMQKEGCYAEPKYTADSKEVQAACDTMNTYCKASITYTMGENVVVDKTLISEWLSVDEDMNVTFNTDAVRTWLTEFGDTYDTQGTTRTITTPTGKTTEVSGGDYGWSIDEDAEFEALTNSIKNGETVTKEPAYYQTAAVHGAQDWGTTYLEVDLSAQHMWYIIDGGVALETDVVTGEPIPAKITPTGVYSILEMSQNETLVGEIDPSTGEPEYRTPVAYWMRVTWSGIGFHDATWQPAFGGSLYQDGLGSHGCINMPLDQAASLYSMLSTGTPVIIHN
ncbi:L,D-transpeptidase family protein [Mediterraneibacter sp. ICN-202921]|uniref:L,D-transpeptidase family protein n=1 Tax=Mediterraneibacter sp. ICN-202921 TaxID=3134657 RepID=UPI0030C266AC